MKIFVFTFVTILAGTAIYFFWKSGKDIRESEKKATETKPTTIDTNAFKNAIKEAMEQRQKFQTRNSNGLTQLNK